MRLRLALLTLGLFLSGCNSQITDYVDGARRDPSQIPSTSTDSPMSFKITPGKMNSATTNNGAIRGTVTTTGRLLNLGSDMSMSVTINRVRTSPAPVQ